ncbi:MAG: putative metal-dependent peptidase [Myxococcota bacterium]|jgi:predicted metal-dependent peptidase
MSALLAARPLTPAEQQTYAAARLHAVHALMPYLATAVFRLRPWAVDGLGTFAVDARWRLYLDPEVMESWGVPASAGVLLHEVGHALRDHAGHAERMGDSIDRYAWNICGDAAINDDLVAADVPLPGGPVLPSTLADRDGRPMPDGRTAHEYYALLPQALLPQALLPAEDVAGDIDAPDDRSPGEHPGLGLSVTRVPGRGAAPGASCGEVAGGDAPDVEAPASDMGVSEVEQRLTRRAVAAAVAAAGSQGRGRAPAGLQRWAATELAPPVVSWQQQLRGAVRSGVAYAAGAVDTTYSRPSRRRVPGVVLPGSRRPLPSVAIVVDTSASMDDELLAAALAEVEGIARAVGAAGDHVRVLAVDSQVHEAGTVRRASEVLLRGGGGTNLGPGIIAAVRARPAPHVVVVLTDGWTPWPSDRPARGTRFVVVVLDSPVQAPAPTPPSWATTIHIPVVAA